MGEEENKVRPLLDRKEFKQLIRIMHLIRIENKNEVKLFKEYNTFVYTIACNVPFSQYEEGSINKKIMNTSTKMMLQKEKKGYFYLESLEKIDFNRKFKN